MVCSRDGQLTKPIAKIERINGLQDGPYALRVLTACIRGVAVQQQISIVQPPTADVTPVRPAMSPAAAAASPARARSVHEDKALEGLQQLEAQASQQVMRLEFLLESLSESVAPIVVHPTPAV